jgi:hypothetical protein
MGMMMFYSHAIPLKRIGLPEWIPPARPWIQSINRINVDIANEINPFKYTIATETIEDIIKNEPRNNRSFGEQAEKTALEIKEKTQGHNVYLMYSGGIDSTTALVAMMNTWGHDLDRLYILMSSRSILEFPEMWHNINMTFKGRIINSIDCFDEFYKSGYIITGEHGDQVFGSDQILAATTIFGETIIHKNWKDYIHHFYNLQFNKTCNVNKLIDLFSQTTDYCPFKIVTMFDWVWWINFTNKWQLVKYRSLITRSTENLKEKYERVINFYSSPSWQKWSLDNHDQKIKNTMLSYKFPAKEYIVKNTGFIEYLKKPKVGSLQHVSKNFVRPDGLDENFNVLNINQCLEFVNNGK